MIFRDETSILAEAITTSIERKHNAGEIPFYPTSAEPFFIFHPHSPTQKINNKTQFDQHGSVGEENPPKICTVLSTMVIH